MKLIRMSYQDQAAKWGFDGLVFDPHVTLLVGASGVGKTRVLESYLTGMANPPKEA